MGRQRKGTKKREEEQRSMRITVLPFKTKFKANKTDFGEFFRIGRAAPLLAEEEHKRFKGTASRPKMEGSLAMGRRYSRGSVTLSLAPVKNRPLKLKKRL